MPYRDTSSTTVESAAPSKMIHLRSWRERLFRVDVHGPDHQTLLGEIPLLETVGDEVEVEPASVASRPVPRGYRADLGEPHRPRFLLQADHDLEQPLPAEFLAEPSEFEQDRGDLPAVPAAPHLLPQRSDSLAGLPPLLQGSAGDLRLHDGRRDLRGV